MNENAVMANLSVRKTQLIGAGITDPYYGNIDCVVKLDEPHGIASEYIAHELAKFLGLPVAPGFITYINGEPEYVTMRVTSARLPRGDRYELQDADPKNAAGMGVFDVLTGNCDRHDGNYSIIDGKLFMFDHGYCFFERNMGYTNSSPFINAANLKHAQAFVRKVKRIPKSYVRAIFDHIRSINWVDYIPDDGYDWDKMEAALWNRIRNFDDFINLPRPIIPSEPVAPRRRWTCGLFGSCCETARMDNCHNGF